MKSIASIIYIILTSLTVAAQYEKIDSLKLILQQENNDTAVVGKLIQIGRAYSEIKNDSALIFLQEALRLSEKTGYKNGELRSRRYYAIHLNSVKSDYAAALDVYLRNLKAEEEAGDTNSIFLDVRDISVIYAIIEDKQKQFEYINKLRSLINSGITKDSIKLLSYNVILNVQLGGFYSNPKMNKLDSAKYFRALVYNLGLKNNSPVWIALGSGGLAEVYRIMKKTDSAVYYFHMCRQSALKINRNDLYGESLVGLGKVYLEEEKKDSAYYYGIKAYNFMQREKDAARMIDASELLAEIYYSKGQPDSAYNYLKQTMQVKDSLFSSEKIYRIQNLGFNETLKKQQEEQTKREAIQEFKSKIQIYSLVGGLAILSLIIFMLYRNNRQRQASNIKIEKAYEDLKSTQAQLIQSEKMASLGELTAGIAHEIQNPLNFVNNFSELNTELISELKDEIEKGNTKEMKALADDIKSNELKINHHGKRADAIVKGMLQHSRSSCGVKEPTDINALADEYLRLAYHGLRAKDKSFNATLKTDFDESIGNINVMPQDIGRVILNLITNAFYAVVEKKKQNPEGYEPLVSVITKKIGDEAEIRVKDNGNGIPQNVMNKIFQPFFTTKPTGQGTGLGLSLSYDIIKAHNGELKVETKEGEGSDFIIQLQKN